ncbi:MAG: GerMN domain-containing protein [Firmicutes bacterium]|nr:GerMN domain-containing protein [Bacillota bacterium]
MRTRTFRWMCILLVWVILAAGCGETSGDSSQVLDEGYEWVRLYDTNETATMLHEEQMALSVHLSTEERVYAVLKAILEPPEGWLSIVPAGFDLSYRLEAPEGETEEEAFSSLKLFIEGQYNELAPNAENVLRGGIMKTFIRLRDIASVELFADTDGDPATPLMQVSYLTQDTVIINEKDENFFRDTMELRLYFLNPDQTGLELERRVTTLLMSDRSVDKVMEMLLQGPQTEGLISPFPAGSAVNEILIRNNICYLDLNEAFVRNQIIQSELQDQLTIYAIVNSLTSIYGIDSVQFLIDGQQTEAFRSVKINSPLSFNEELVSKG